MKSVPNRAPVISKQSWFMRTDRTWKELVESLPLANEATPSEQDVSKEMKLHKEELKFRAKNKSSNHYKDVSSDDLKKGIENAEVYLGLKDVKEALDIGGKDKEVKEDKPANIKFAKHREGN